MKVQAMHSCRTKLLEGEQARSLISAQSIEDLPRILSLLKFRVTLPLPSPSPAAQGQSLTRGAGSRAESGAESLAEGSLAASVLQALARGPLSKSEIAQALGRDSVSGALNRTIRQLLDRDEIGYTLPDTPNSRLQKYRRRGQTRR